MKRQNKHSRIKDKQMWLPAELSAQGEKFKDNINDEVVRLVLRAVKKMSMGGKQ